MNITTIFNETIIKLHGKGKLLSHKYTNVKSDKIKIVVQSFRSNKFFSFFYCKPPIIESFIRPLKEI